MKPANAMPDVDHRLLGEMRNTLKCRLLIGELASTAKGDDPTA